MGLGIGGTIDTAVSAISGRDKEARSLSEGMRNIARDNFGYISSDDGLSMAKLMQDKAYSFEGRTQDYNLDQMQENVIGFANSGGFSNVGSSEDMERVLNGVIENTRQFAESLKLKQSDAVQIMAQLEKDMIRNTEEMDSFGSELSRFGGKVGMNPMESLNFALGGADLSKNYGLTGRSGFDFAMESRLQTERMMQSDPETRLLVNTLGGPESYARSQQQSAYQYINSSSGMVGLTGMLGGSSSLSGFGDNFSGFSNFLDGGLESVLEFQALKPELISRMDLGGIQSMKVDQAMQMYRSMGQDPSNKQAFIGFYAANYNMDINSARAEVESFLSNDPHESAVENIIEGTIDARNRQYADQSSSFGGRVKAFFGGIGDSIYSSQPISMARAGVRAASSYVNTQNLKYSDRSMGLTRLSVDNLGYYENENFSIAQDLFFNPNREESLFDEILFDKVSISPEEERALSEILGGKGYRGASRARALIQEGRSMPEIERMLNDSSNVTLRESGESDEGIDWEYAGLDRDQRRRTQRKLYEIQGDDRSTDYNYNSYYGTQRQLQANLDVDEDLRSLAYSLSNNESFNSLSSGDSYSTDHYQSILDEISKDERVRNRIDSIENMSFSEGNVGSQAGALVRMIDEVHTSNRSEGELRHIQLARQSNEERISNDSKVLDKEF